MLPLFLIKGFAKFCIFQFPLAFKSQLIFTREYYSGIQFRRPVAKAIADKEADRLINRRMNAELCEIILKELLNRALRYSLFGIVIGFPQINWTRLCGAVPDYRRRSRKRFFRGVRFGSESGWACDVNQYEGEQVFIGAVALDIDLTSLVAFLHLFTNTTFLFVSNIGNKYNRIR